MTMPDELRGQYRPWSDKSTPVPLANLDAVVAAARGHGESIKQWADRLNRRRQAAIEAWLRTLDADPERDELVYVSDARGTIPRVVHLVPQTEAASLEGTTPEERAARYPTLILSTV